MGTDFILPRLGPIAETIVLWLQQALIFGSLLAGLTWILTRCLRRHLTPQMLMAFWALVLIKFLLPVGPASSFSLASLCRPVAQAATGAASEMDVLRVPSDTAAATDDDVLPGPVSAATFTWHLPAVAAYLLCIAAFGFLRFRAYSRLRRQCISLLPADRLTTALVHRVCKRIGIRTFPIVRISREHRAPFVMGLVRPLLVISRRHLVRPDELETVVVHEVTHLRQGERLVRCLQAIAGTVLFFWPVVPWVNRQIDEAREHVCDEGALRHGRLSPSEYATCLLHAAQPAAFHRYAYQPACMAGRPSTIERRIDMILASPSRPLRRRAWGLAVLTFLLAWGGFTLTGAADDDTNRGAQDKTYDITLADFQRHADDLYARIQQYDAGDVNGDGKISKEECWAFVTTIALQQPAAFLKTYPAADFDKDGQLCVAEAYFFTRGDLELDGISKEMDPELKKAAKADDKGLVKELRAKKETREIEAWHVVLDRRARIIDEMQREPTRQEVKETTAKLADVDDQHATKSKLSSAIGQLRDLQKKAQAVREKAGKAEGAEAEELNTKADKLEQTAEELKLKIIAVMKDEIAKMESAGKMDIAAKLKKELASIESE